MAEHSTTASYASYGIPAYTVFPTLSHGENREQSTTKPKTVNPTVGSHMTTHDAAVRSELDGFIWPKRKKPPCSDSIGYCDLDKNSIDTSSDSSNESCGCNSTRREKIRVGCVGRHTFERAPGDLFSVLILFHFVSFQLVMDFFKAISL